MAVVIQCRIGHGLYARLKCGLSIGFSHELLGDVHRLGSLYLYQALAVAVARACQGESRISGRGLGIC